jgi:single-stranded-DNA-specific exonuclease
MRWSLSAVDPEKVERLVRTTRLSPLVARLLVLRGLESAESAHRFLEPRLAHLHDPNLMADMGVAVERLRQAIARNEKILIYGDYDVDGTMAVVVLLTALGALGARVEAHIPHRLADGYGMRIPQIERAAAEGFGVMLSVDTGIREHGAIARAQDLGVDCIVTDHHLPETTLPPARAILNPRRNDCAYPDKNLSGVGVAFKLAQALLAERMTERQLESYLKIVAIGTVADVVPLVGENRVIATFGLQGLRRPAQPGLEALLKVAGLLGRPVTASDVGFRIAPRLNAAGRMEDARDVIRLLQTEGAEEARAIAENLEALNRERQRVEDLILREILGQMAENAEKARRYTLVFSGQGWHRGVIGIVAQRVVERYYRPTLVIGVEDGVGQGSGRSVANFHLLEALTESCDLFERFGGHAQAAGFTLPAERVAELEERFERHARSRLTLADLEPQLNVDAELDMAELDWAFYDQLKQLEPFGMGNPTPVFRMRNLRVLAPPRIVGEKHLKLKVARGSKVFDAIAWGKADRVEAVARDQQMDIAFSLGENSYQGTTSLQMILRDFRAEKRGEKELRESARVVTERISKPCTRG